jgi:putative transposase
MPAFARVVIPGIPYHVTQRGNYCQDIFFTPEDRIVYLDYLASAANAYGLELHGWCLMSNHVHWIVVPLHKDAMAQSSGAPTRGMPVTSTASTNEGADIYGRAVTTLVR